MTKADVDRMQQQMQGMMAQMQNLPPAVRAQMEARGMGAAPMTPAKREYRRNGTDKVGRWTCDKYHVIQNGQLTGSLCTVAPSALGVALGEFEIAQQMASFFASAMPQMANEVSTVGKLEEQGFSGFPVKQVTTVSGQTVTVEVTEIKRQPIDDALFVVPAGFTKQDILGGMGPGRARGTQTR